MRIQKALLLYPSQFYCCDRETPPIVLKTQLLKLFAYLRHQGASVDIVDLELEFGRPVSSVDCERFLQGAKSRMEGGRYDFVGISCYTSMSYLSTIAVSRLARELYPQAIIAVGGYHCLGKAADFNNELQIDFVVRGSGLMFLDALCSNKRIDRICTFSGTSTGLGSLPYNQYPYRHVDSPGVAHLQLSQGCPFQCSFCCEPYSGNSKYEPLGVDEALGEVDLAVNSLAPRKIVIEDVIFG